MKVGQKNKLTAVAVLSVSSILTSGVAINGTLPLMKEQLSLTQTQSELLGTLPSIAVIIFILLSTPISAMIGMKKTVLTGLILVAIGGVMPYFFSNNYPMIVLGRLILGTGYGLYNALSVSFINGLYDGKERSSLLGLRNATESIGQMILTFLAGVLLSFSWKDAYFVYLFALPIAILFYFFVPNIPAESSHKKNKKEDRIFSWWLLATILVGSFSVMNAIAISVRFPTLAIELRGVGENTSLYLSLLPVLGIVAGIYYEKVTVCLKEKTMYLAVIVNIIANLCIALSTNSWILLLVGLLISSIPVSWIIPFLFNHVEELAQGVSPNKATSYIFVGCNTGVFLSPILMQGIGVLFGVDSLRFPYFIFASIFILMLLIFILFRKQINERLYKK